MYKIIGMENYFDNFINEGYDELSIVIEMDDDELQQIGIQKKGHRKKLLAKMKEFKSKNNQQIEGTHYINNLLYTQYCRQNCIC